MNMGPHNKGRLPQDNALKGQMQNQNRPTLTKLKHPLDLGNCSIPTLRGQVGPVSPHQQKAERENLRPIRPTTLQKQSWKMSCGNYDN